MSRICTTNHLFKDIIYELPFLVKLIDTKWFSNARWFQKKGACICEVVLHDWVTLSKNDETISGISILKIAVKEIIDSRIERESDRQVYKKLYNVPFILTKIESSSKETPLVIINGSDFIAYLYDAVNNKIFIAALLKAVKERKSFQSGRGFFKFDYSGIGVLDSIEYKVCARDKGTTNTIITIDKSYVVKIYRILQPGTSLEIMITENLIETGFSNIPKPLGHCTYLGRKNISYPVLFIQEYIENQGDAWEILCAEIYNYSKEQLGNSSESSECPRNNFDKGQNNIDFHEINLGAITAKLHYALANIEGSGFKPEIISPKDIVELIEGIICSALKTIKELKSVNAFLNTFGIETFVYELLTEEKVISKCMQRAKQILMDTDDLGMKIKTHGDLHLGQFLKVKDSSVYDFVIIDFEGEPLRSVSSRAKKVSPLRDIAGMLNSFEYAGYFVAFNKEYIPNGKIYPINIIKKWGRDKKDRFLESYLSVIKRYCDFLVPKNPDYLEILLLCFRLEKAFYEIRYELQIRPDWVKIAARIAFDNMNRIIQIFHLVNEV